MCTQELCLKSGRQQGVWAPSLPTGGGWHLLRMDKTAGLEGPETVCFLKSLLVSVYAGFSCSFRLDVIRLLA